MLDATDTVEVVSAQANAVIVELTFWMCKIKLSATWRLAEDLCWEEILRATRATSAHEDPF